MAMLMRGVLSINYQSPSTCIRFCLKTAIFCALVRPKKTGSCHKGDITLKFCFYGHHLPSQHLEEDINQIWPTLLKAHSE